MRRDNTPNPRLAKQVARQKYAERQIDKFVSGLGIRKDMSNIKTL